MDYRPTGYGCLREKAPSAPLTKTPTAVEAPTTVGSPSGPHDSQYFRDDNVDAHAGGIDENRIGGRLERRDGS